MPPFLMGDIVTDNAVPLYIRQRYIIYSNLQNFSAYDAISIIALYIVDNHLLADSSFL